MRQIETKKVDSDVPHEIESPFVACIVPEHTHASRSDRANPCRDANQSELRELLTRLSAAEELSYELVPALRIALVENLIELRAKEDLDPEVDALRREQAGLIQEIEESSDPDDLKTKAETLRKWRISPSEMGSISLAMADASKAETEHEVLRHRLEFPLRGVWQKFNRWASSLPLIGKYFEYPDSDLSELETAATRHVQSLEKLHQAQTRLIRHEEATQERARVRVKQTNSVTELTEKLAQVNAKIEDLSQFRPSCIGAVRLSPSARVLALTLQAVSDAQSRPIRELLDEEFSLRSEVRGQIERVSQISESLITEWHYPPAGAELISWQLVHRSGAVEKLTEQFHRRNLALARTLEPSYAQLLLTLKVMSEGRETAEVFKSLSKLGSLLPNFPEAERLLVAAAKEKIVAKSDKEKQERLFSFVNLLNSPIGERLDGFERHLIAANLGSLEGETSKIGESYAFTHSKLVSLGAKPNFRTALASVTLMRSGKLGDSKFEPLERVLDVYRQIGVPIDEQVILDASFISLLPGNPSQYMRPIVLAREELGRLGINGDKAKTLTLPVALSAINSIWKSEVDREAISVAKQVGRLDGELATKVFSDEAEEVRKLRLEEQLLIQLSRLSDLYAEADQFSVHAIFSEFAAVSSAKAAREIAKASAKPAEVEAENDVAEEHEPEKDVRPETERIDALIDAEEEILRKIRDLRFSSEGGK